MYFQVQNYMKEMPEDKNTHLQTDPNSQTNVDDGNSQK